jgi:hypothetical protein
VASTSLGEYPHNRSSFQHSTRFAQCLSIKPTAVHWKNSEAMLQNKSQKRRAKEFLFGHESNMPRENNA